MIILHIILVMDSVSGYVSILTHYPPKLIKTKNESHGFHKMRGHHYSDRTQVYDSTWSGQVVLISSLKRLVYLTASLHWGKKFLSIIKFYWTIGAFYTCRWIHRWSWSIISCGLLTQSCPYFLRVYFLKVIGPCIQYCMCDEKRLDAMTNKSCSDLIECCSTFTPTECDLLIFDWNSCCVIKMI